MQTNRTQEYVPHLLAIGALHPRPILRLAALARDVSELIAVAAFHHFLLLALGSAMAFLPTIAAHLRLASWAIAAEKTLAELRIDKSVEIHT